MVLTDCYENSISFLFEGINNLDDESEPGPFSSTIRSLLVENIMTYLYIDNGDLKKKHILKKIKSIIKEIIKNNEQDQDQVEINYLKELDNNNGLPYMIDKGIFIDAFILHDESNFHLHIKEILEHRNHEYEDDVIEPETNLNFNEDGQQINDVRLDLHDNWAHFKNIFKFQPLGLIKDYFGERFGFYFAWTGVFITTLWVPSIIGVVFFFTGLGFS